MKGSVTTTPGPSLAKEGSYYVHLSQGSWMSDKVTKMFV